MSLDWYAIQTYSGSEQAVKRAIENLVQEYKIGDRLKEIVVPTEDIIEISKKSKNKVTAQSLYPGYVFIKVDLDTALWHKIQSLPKVSRFIGESKKPTPLGEADINHILEKVRNRAAPKPKISFESGEVVRIVEGPFANFTATVEEYDIEHRKLKLNVSIFGRNTPIEILYSQVEKIV
ncbi:transcription termination/antitermination protein NusG [Helicobacter sp. 11S03491-1]|uniref:transcription termination/antitermination protein NusG n=1 Tax=Helicobacter sp. 11S03491-1 TaxID=1476196 RepID=UPI000BA4F803|nr:transcription termination/antitermination protein NusG [Helicobacter sp. 11S03491-1]PAF43719.1 transcription termination/antitermination protein NusG [Helicobacter sp. 11S03491-1]